MAWIPKNKQQRASLFVSLLLVAVVVVLLALDPPAFRQWVIELESNAYDSEVRRYRRGLDADHRIAIVDIDDASIALEGRWPWDRAKMARLAEALFALGAKVVAFDMVFSDPEPNPALVIAEATADRSLSRELRSVAPQFDGDRAFAGSLQRGLSLLGFAFASNGEKVGVLPPPLTVLPQGDTLMLSMDGYIGNLPMLQQATAGGGFLNTTIDADGILRFSPLVMVEGEAVYPSLALEAARIYQNVAYAGIETVKTADGMGIRGVRLGEQTIPTDLWGRVLIPFRGPPYSFPYISAANVLRGQVTESEIAGKLVFVGTAATGATDFLATAISPVFPGVEVQASIASGILDGYLPRKPLWGRGASIALVAVLGSIAAFLFPRISMIWAFAISLGVIAVLKGINHWCWTQRDLVLSFFFPAPTLVTIFIIDLISVFLADRRRKAELKQAFGSALSSNQLEQFIEARDTLILTGEKKTVTFLAARFFEEPALQRSPEEVCRQLRAFHSTMDEILHKQGAVIEQSAGFEIRAFWGAPLELEKQEERSLVAARVMAQTAKESGGYRIAIGIDTGTAVVGEIGRRYGPIGSPVERAAALLDRLGQEGGVAATAATYEASEKQQGFEVQTDRSIGSYYRLRLEFK
jgi:adenylate cyclase